AGNFRQSSILRQSRSAPRFACPLPRVHPRRSPHTVRCPRSPRPGQAALQSPSGGSRSRSAAAPKESLPPSRRPPWAAHCVAPSSPAGQFPPPPPRSPLRKPLRAPHALPSPRKSDHASPRLPPSRQRPAPHPSLCFSSPASPLHLFHPGGCSALHKKSYKGGSPRGRFFHLAWTHTHWSGYFLMISSITSVKRLVFSKTSCSVSPMRTSSTGGSKRKRYFRKFSSQYAQPGTTAASVCRATRAIPVV